MTLTVYTAGEVLTALSLNDNFTFAAANGGKIIQVVEGASNTSASSTSATYVDTGLTVSITPTLATSKILVFAAHTVYTSANATSCAIRIVRDSTTLTQSIDQSYTPSGGGLISTWSLMDLDSPATTSATTYKTTFARNSGAGTVTVNSGSNASRIIVMEVSA